MGDVEVIELLVGVLLTEMVCDHGGDFVAFGDVAVLPSYGWPRLVF